MIAVDSSAIFAVLFHEDDHEVFADFLATGNEFVATQPTLLECHFVAHGADQNLGRQLLKQFVAGAAIQSVAFDTEMSHAAIDARYRYGKGTKHPAELNFGDCFSYALAKTRNIPLLYKGDDFSHTDIVSALDVIT